MDTIKHGNEEYSFSVTPDERKKSGECLSANYAENKCLLRLIGQHSGPPIEVWAIGIYPEDDGDEEAGYTYWWYKALWWRDETPLTDEETDLVGDFYEVSIGEYLNPTESD